MNFKKLYVKITLYFNYIQRKADNMKNTKKCPKCGSIDILIVDGYAGAYGSGNNIMTGSTIFSAVKVNRYLCCDCGFTEEWVDKKDINQIEKSKRAHR